MKKILLGMILIVLSFSLTGCNNDETSSHENSETIYVESKIIDNLKIECDEVFSLRLSGKERIIGFLELGVLEILCYDPGHEFIQSSKKHT